MGNYMSERVSNLATICSKWADRFIHGVIVTDDRYGGDPSHRFNSGKETLEHVGGCYLTVAAPKAAREGSAIIPAA